MKLVAAITLALTAGAAPIDPPQAATRAAARMAGDCAGEGGLGFLCGLANVEDLAPIDGGRFLVGSSLKAGSAGLYLIDVAARSGRPVNLSIGGSPDPSYSGCNAPDLTALATHGLAARPGPNGTTTVYAINHGGRESLEIFRLDPIAGAAAWIGCILMPAGTSGNAVAILPNGRLAISKFNDADDPHGIDRVLAGEKTGLVYIWTPRRGFRPLPHSRLSGDNGLAVSGDRKWLFVNAYGSKEIWRLPLQGTDKPIRAVVPFRPDNLSWAPDGTLFVTGQFIEPGKRAGLHDWATARLDPRTMSVTPMLRMAGQSAFDSATTTVQAGDALWFGTFRGSRVAYWPLR